MQNMDGWFNMMVGRSFKFKSIQYVERQDEKKNGDNQLSILGTILSICNRHDKTQNPNAM